MIDEYTRLLEAAAELGDRVASEAAVTKLIMHLKSAGRMKMLPQIARELKNIAARRRALGAKVEVAHEKESAGALRAAAALGIEAKKAVVNTSLIRGWRARKGDVLIDHSAKQALIHIYQNVIV